MKRREFIRNVSFTTTMGAIVPFSFSCKQGGTSSLETFFQSPPDEARPWVFWFWINGNISKNGITADLEAMKEAGIGGFIWMEVSGSYWAPKGKIKPNSKEWHDAFQWAISECRRLGLEFDMTFNFGYGCGGPWITPENSMQKLIWTETVIEGGKKKCIALEKPVVDRSQLEKFKEEWFRHDEPINPEVSYMLNELDSYKDIAVFAFPLSENKEAANYRIPELEFESGLIRYRKDFSSGMNPNLINPPQEALIAKDKMIDVSGFIDETGQLNWDAPEGMWQIIRFGHASNLRLTRPCPANVIGLECDRLSKTGIEAHFNAFEKKVIEESGSNAGKSLTFAHIDSWEAHAQNWTASFPDEFEKRRGYNPIPWLPVLSGRVVESSELTSRFLFDFRNTTSEMMLDNYVSHFKQLLKPYGIKLSIEAYGNMANDNISYADIADMPVSEFWVNDKTEIANNHYRSTSKVMSSSAHTMGKKVIGAEAWTSGRGWDDHPSIIKRFGDKIFTEGVNKMICHLSAHQAYDNMIPGLTHRKWGMHFNRFNTWWQYSRPWNDYLTRCQFMLRQGNFVADVIYWYGEGSPVNVREMRFDLPQGYDFDYASTEIIKQAQVKDGMIVLPSGMSYRYLLLPDDTRITLAMMRKVKGLVDAGATVIAQKRFESSPSLSDFPTGDSEIRTIAIDLFDNNRIIFGKTLMQVLEEDKLPPDFCGEGLNFIHRRTGNDDIYFIANPENKRIEGLKCMFRVVGKTPELWNPETGKIQTLPEYSEKEGRTNILIDFEPSQSWLVVFRKNPSVNAIAVKTNFQKFRELSEITSSWSVTFDPQWTNLKNTVVFDSLIDWSKHSNPDIRYFSGTATYKNNFELTQKPDSPVWLDLGNVQVIAHVRVNGKDCGIAWKPPYRLDISSAVCVGENSLEINVVNTWVNRLIGDEHLPLDSEWKDWEILERWPEWFLKNEKRPSGRFTFTSCRHYTKDSELSSSGLLGPVKLIVKQ